MMHFYQRLHLPNLPVFASSQEEKLIEILTQTFGDRGGRGGLIIPADCSEVSAFQMREMTRLFHARRLPT